MKKLLSVAIATFNEEANLADCLKSVKKIADEIVIVDGESSDKTVQIANSFGARVEIVPNNPMFHINKQKAFDLCQGEWILYLDADERVSVGLAEEILRVIKLPGEKLTEYEYLLKNRDLFLRHQHLLEQRDGVIGESRGEYNAFFVPRLNFFLGRYLKHGGVYPDGVIRLFKKGKAYLPCKDIHEQLVVKGRVGWLEHDLYHYDSPTFSRYIARNSRYVKLLAKQLKKEGLKKNPVTFADYMIIRPISWFFTTQIRHKGLLDGWQGIVFSFFSALRFPRAYLRYLHNNYD